MKIKKAMFKLSIFAMMSFVAVSSVLLNAKASNDDTPWRFYISTTDTSYRNGEIREKEDYSSVYLYWMESDGVHTLNVMVYGSKAESNSGMIPCGNRSDAQVYTISSLGQYSIYNSVKEKGNSYAQLRYKSQSGNGNVSGKWSPDSTGSYTVLN